MDDSTKQKIRHHRLRAALLYWLWLPGLVIGLGRLVDTLLHLPRFRCGLVGQAAAALLLAAGLLLIAWSERDLAIAGHGTPSPAAPSRRLVATGSYRLCRHPMSLGYDLAALAVVVFTGSPAALLVSYPLLLLWQVRLLRREEGILARRFAGEYQAYQTSVPFLIPLLPSRR